MQMSSVTENSTAKSVEVQKQAISDSLLGVEIGLLTGCQDRPYAFGLAMALVSKHVGVDIIGGDDIDSPELHATPNLRFLDFRGSQKNNANFADKVSKVMCYYLELIRNYDRSEAQ